jgi:hypothetical protein
MDHPRAKRRFANETGNRRPVLAQAFAQYLYGNGTVFWVLGLVDGGSATFSNTVKQEVSGNGRADEGVASHAANLTVRHGAGKENL